MLRNHLPHIGLIAVNYNSAQATADLLADLGRQDTSGCELTVVIADSSPSAAALAPLRESYRHDPWVVFETMEDNPGYFGAAHRAFEGRWASRIPDWVIVSNADVRLPRRDLLARIARLPRRGGAIAPRIVSGRTGLDQNPFLRRRPMPARMLLNRIIPRVPALFWMLETQYAVKRGIRSRLAAKTRQRRTSVTPAEPRPIYAPHGSFLLFSREYFERGGTLNAGAFLYAEEIFVAETCRRLGLEVLYRPDLELQHDEHVSTGGNPAVRRFLASAADYCFREFFIKPAA